MSERLADKVVLVTGTAGGIGSAVVRRFAAAGARVVATDLDAEGLDRLAAEVSGVRSHAADITDADGVAMLFAAMDDAFGRIDILVNNAGIGGPRTQRLHEVALEDFDRVMAANLRAPLAMTQAALPRMVAQGGGAIVNLASPAGFHAVPRVGAYSISKAAMIMLTKQTAKEYAADGIRCNAGTHRRAARDRGDGRLSGERRCKLRQWFDRDGRRRGGELIGGVRPPAP